MATPKIQCAHYFGGGDSANVARPNPNARVVHLVSFNSQRVEFYCCNDAEARLFQAKRQAAATAEEVNSNGLPHTSDGGPKCRFRQAYTRRPSDFEYAGSGLPPRLGGWPWRRITVNRPLPDVFTAAHRAAWWRRKILGNRARDARVTRALRRAGWRVLRVWEHELARKNEARLVSRLRRVLG